MTRRLHRLAVLLAVPLAACSWFRPHPKPPQAMPHYVLESAWQAPDSGAWFYPHESFTADETGLAAVYAGPHPPQTTDGEDFDQDAMAAAHQTLQLPAIVRVTNLQNGRQVELRVNDRGPDSPARIVELTRHAADLLGIAPDGTAQVRVQVVEAPSRALAGSLQREGPLLKIAAAPVGAVHAESLPPPAGIAESGGASLPQAPLPSGAPVAAPALPPLRLPATVTQTTPDPGQLWLQGDTFGRADYAERQRAQLAGLPVQVERLREGRSTSYRVRAGPFPTVTDADAALDQARRAGVTDARIIVESGGP
ncbi:MAG TPA: septal ring lytic transglycosylase RlpA family protein [Acetobacteraceae bacterium]|nr:septal ring lytic transglycosylase RlpA family protein [Acetobacteraceae bacterium]